MAAHPGYIQVGATVVVRDGDGARQTYVVVPPADASPRTGRVSSQSPIGRALLGRYVGETVIVPAPGGSFSLTIEAVNP